jgi:hypothetical protein
MKIMGYPMGMDRQQIKIFAFYYIITTHTSSTRHSL